MASREVALSSGAGPRGWELELSPLDKVQQFFQALFELHEAAEDSPDDRERFVVPGRVRNLA